VPGLGQDESMDDEQREVWPAGGLGGSTGGCHVHGCAAARCSNKSTLSVHPYPGTFAQASAALIAFRPRVRVEAVGPPPVDSCQPIGTPTGDQPRTHPRTAFSRGLTLARSGPDLTRESSGHDAMSCTPYMHPHGQNGVHQVTSNVDCKPSTSGEATLVSRSNEKVRHRRTAPNLPPLKFTISMV
jgi:hypothetical protein